MIDARTRLTGWVVGLSVAFLSFCHTAVASSAGAAPAAAGHPWWFWPIILFFFCLVLGILAVMAGVGGGVLYVPLVSGFFPFHIDFVRGVGLMVALAGALAAGPGLLRRNLANLRLALPVALIASTFSILGAMLGLYLSALNPDIIQTCLGGFVNIRHSNLREASIKSRTAMPQMTIPNFVRAYRMLNYCQPD